MRPPPSLWFDGTIVCFGVRLRSGFPRQNGFDGESRLSSGVFPRQSCFGGFSECGLNGINPPKSIWRVNSLSSRLARAKHLKKKQWLPQIYETAINY